MVREHDPPRREPFTKRTAHTNSNAPIPFTFRIKMIVSHLKRAMLPRQAAVTLQNCVVSIAKTTNKAIRKCGRNLVSYRTANARGRAFVAQLSLLVMTTMLQRNHRL